MKALEALNEICKECHKNIQLQPSHGMLPHKECPFRHISNDYCPNYEVIANALKQLEELENVLKIIKEYILKDVAIFTNEKIAFLQVKFNRDLICFAMPYEKLYEIKEYLK